MSTIRIEPDTEIPVHHDTVAGAVVTLAIEITDIGKLRAEAERIFIANEAAISHDPSAGEIDSLFGPPDAPDLNGCLNFLFPTRYPGADVIDVEIRSAMVERR